jgi:hypothetical protein
MTTSLANLPSHLSKQYDVFIASASFEDRCLSIVNAIDNEIAFVNKIVSANESHKDLIKKNLEVFEQKGFSVVPIDIGNQLSTANGILLALNSALELKPNASFLIDITTFTKQTLLILLRLLRNVLNTSNSIQLLYTPAKDYSIGLPYEEKWLTRGVIGVNSVLGYSGIIRPSRPYHLIILLGYEVERAAALINAYEPTRISIGYAKQHDSISKEHHDLNRNKILELLSEFPYADPFEFSCGVVEECINDISKQIEKHKSFNVVLSPMNNKISTVACALTAFSLKEVQLAIAIPGVYNFNNYSESSYNCSLLEVPGFLKAEESPSKKR